MKLTKEQFEEAIDLVIKDAELKKEDAGYNGSYDDGGYSSTMYMIKVFREGMDYALNGTTPDFLKDYLKKLDPEYQEFIRLKKKFN